MTHDRNRRLVQQRIKTLRKSLGEWADEVKDGAVADLEKYLAGDPWTAIKVLPNQLDQFAWAKALAGVVGVMDGNSDDWRNIDEAALYYYWHLKLHTTAYFWSVDQGRPKDVVPVLASDTSLTAHLLAYSLFAFRDWQGELSDKLVKMVSAVALNDYETWQTRIYEPFVLMLFQKDVPGTLPLGIADRHMGSYEGILENWNEPAKLTEPLLKICDYHCENMIDKGVDEEFDVPPFDLYPVEILAIYKVREQLGLDTPKINHPLMATPLASLAQRQVAPIDDPIIKRVEKLYRDFFAEIA